MNGFCLAARVNVPFSRAVFLNIKLAVIYFLFHQTTETINAAVAIAHAPYLVVIFVVTDNVVVAAVKVERLAGFFPAFKNVSKHLHTIYRFFKTASYIASTAYYIPPFCYFRFHNDLIYLFLFVLQKYKITYIPPNFYPTFLLPKTLKITQITHNDHTKNITHNATQYTHDHLNTVTQI